MEEEIIIISYLGLLTKRVEAAKRRRMLRHLRDTSDPFSMQEAVFMQTFRFPRILCRELMRKLQPYDEQTTSLPFAVRFLSTLYFYAHSSYQKCVGNNYTIPISQPSLSRAIEHISNMIITAKGQLIRFPQSFAERTATKAGFYRMFGIKGTIMALDCTHIAICSPPGNDASNPISLYMNRKGYYTINVEASPDHKSNLNFISQSQPNLIEGNSKLQYLKQPTMANNDTAAIADIALNLDPASDQTKALKYKKYNLNIAGIENYSNLQDSIPHCWSEPAMGNVLRRELEPPVVQQAAFDNTIYRMDITRNVCVREILSEATSSVIAPETAPILTITGRDALAGVGGNVANDTNEIPNVTLTKHSKSLPNVSLPKIKFDAIVDNVKHDEGQLQPSCERKLLPWRVETTTSMQMTSIPALNENLKQHRQYLRSLPVANSAGSEDITQDEGCVSGRLEIRVIPQENSNPEESVYYDALAAAAKTTANNLIKTTITPKSHSFNCKCSSDPNPLSQCGLICNTAALTSSCNQQLHPIQCNESARATTTAEINKDMPTLLTRDTKIDSYIDKIAPINCDGTKTATKIRCVRNNESTTNNNVADSIQSSLNVATLKTTQTNVTKTITSTASENAGSSVDNGNVGNIIIELSNTKTGDSSSTAVTGVGFGSSGIVIGAVSAAASKIPILNQNLRQSKCASWTGCDATTILQTITMGTIALVTQQQPADANNSSNIYDIQSASGNIVADNNSKNGVGVYQSSGITELTPALRRRRESADKYVTDPSHLNLRFPRPHNTSRTRGIPTLLLGHFDDHSSDNSEEQYVTPQKHTALTGSSRFNNGDDHVPLKNAPVVCASNQHELQPKYSEEEILCNMVKDLNSVDNTIRNDITPPPGAPKLENSARLRRYKHNID